MCIITEVGKKEEFYLDINSVSKPTIRSAEDVRMGFGNYESTRMLTFLYPIPPQKDYPYGTVLFLVRESAIDNIIKDILGDFQGSTFILDEKKMELN